MIEQNGLLENIKNEVDNEVFRKIEDFSYKSNIYLLYIVDIHKVTEESLRIGFASYQARFPTRTFEDYLNYKRNWDADKYTFDIEPQGYFIDEQTAISYVVDNVCDINEAGSYPYAIVSSMPLNRVYPNCNERTHRLFHYNRSKEIYEEISWDFNEGTQYLQKAGHRGRY